MIEVKGNKNEEISAEELRNKIKNFDTVVIDLGTGDGRFIYKNAKKNPKNFYIGIDPIAKQMEIYSKKANKDRLNNVLFGVGSIEIIPKELENCADILVINMPWGSLLENLVKPKKDIIQNLGNIVKSGGKAEFIIGYDPEFEPRETKRLDLTEITADFIESEVSPKLEEYGKLKTLLVEKLPKESLEKMETTWAKRLKFGQPRPWFRVMLSKIDQNV